MEQARRSTLADHVHRIARLGARVLINGTWYKVFTCFPQSGRLRPEVLLLAIFGLKLVYKHLQLLIVKQRTKSEPVG
jgi:hypothetical protein